MSRFTCCDMTMSHKILAELLGCDVDDLALFENAKRDADVVDFVRILKKQNPSVSFTSVRRAIEEYIRIDLEREIRHQLQSTTDAAREAMDQSNYTAAAIEERSARLLERLQPQDDVFLSNWGEGNFVLEIRRRENMWQRAAVQSKLQELADKFGLYVLYESEIQGK